MKFRRDGSKGGTWASLACARAVAAFLLLVGASQAHAAQTLVCDWDVEGSSFPACDAPYAVDVGTLVASNVVLTCVGGSGPGICTSVGGFVVWRYGAAIKPGDLVYVGNLEDGSYEYASTVSDWPWEATGGGDGGDGDDWSLEDLDLSVAASAFAAAFSLVGMFWALGRGIGLLVGFLRRM